MRVEVGGKKQIPGSTVNRDTKHKNGIHSTLNMEQITKDKKLYLPLIVTKLKKIGIHKIILFGSLASGDVQLDSDIDLIVVTNDNHLPKT